MVKVTSIKHPINGEAIITGFADAQADVGPSMQIEGLPEGVKIAYGSSIITAKGEIAFLKSDGTWNWV